MKERKKFNIGETKEYCFTRDHYTCVVCKKSILEYGTPQLGHKIPQSEVHKYGEEIIHHPMNMESVCSLKCNASVSIDGDPMAISNLIELIRNEIKKDVAKKQKA